MKKLYVFLLIALLAGLRPGRGQELKLAVGVVMDSLPLNDSLMGRTGLYLPTSFEQSRKWPLLYVVAEGNDLRQVLRYYRNMAETGGYVLAATAYSPDSVSLTRQIVHMGNSLDVLAQLLPLDERRISVSGFGEGGQLAALLPGFIKNVQAVLVLGAAPPESVLSTLRPHNDFVAIIGRTDFAYPDLRASDGLLQGKKVPHFMGYYEGGHQWPPEPELERGVQALTLLAMKAGRAEADPAFVRDRYQAFLQYVNQLRGTGEALLAYEQAEQGLDLFEGLLPTDSLDALRKAIRKMPGYNAQKREATRIWNKEQLQRFDFDLALEEDVVSFNLKNLGWWSYQMEKLRQDRASANAEEGRLALRLEGFVNALADDYIRLVRLEEVPDDDALILLYMLKTITDPEAPQNYLKVVSLTAKYDDFGTALYYLEELLKKGYSDKGALYSLEHTALLRISPEYNALVAKYLGEARYDLPEKTEPENR